MSALVFNMIIASLDARFPFSNNRESRIKKTSSLCLLYVVHRFVKCKLLRIRRSSNRMINWRAKKTTIHNKNKQVLTFYLTPHKYSTPNKLSVNCQTENVHAVDSDKLKAKSKSKFDNNLCVIIIDELMIRLW